MEAHLAGPSGERPLPRGGFKLRSVAPQGHASVFRHVGDQVVQQGHEAPADLDLAAARVRDLEQRQVPEARRAWGTAPVRPGAPARR